MFSIIHLRFGFNHESPLMTRLVISIDIIRNVFQVYECEFTISPFPSLMISENFL